MTSVVRLPVSGPEWMQGLPWVLKAKGELDTTALMNAKLMLEHDPVMAGMFSYDEFRDQVIVNHGMDGDKRRYPRPINDGDDTAITCWLSTRGVSARIANTAALIREIAQRNAFDPLRTWLNGLWWDSEDRLDTWLIRHAEAEDTPYVRTVSAKFLIAAVARAIRPGSKVDTMLVLEGEQGTRKSSMIRTLAGEEYFSDSVGDVRTKEASETIQGRWIVEVAEMDRVLRVESSAVKDFLSKQEDRYRPPYGRNVITRPRRCVFMGTINPMEGTGYLKDPTGARRFWPVMCGAVDIDAVVREREQLWAEAMFRFHSGEHWWLEGDEIGLAAPVQQERFDEDVWKPRVMKWLQERRESGDGAFTSSELLTGLGLDLSKQEHRHKLRVASVLHAAKVRQGYGDVNGKRSRVWMV